MKQLLSKKQAEYIRMATHRWGIKTGATRSGKTYMDILYTIPARITERKKQDGLVVLLGNTRGTLQRNILEPMAEIYGADRVGSIKADNTATLFGERCYCLGADNKKHVDKLRGSSIKYCYGDEITTWNEEVFEMLKSRLDKPCSMFDGTCNPDTPNHWFKHFLDSNADMFVQPYTIDDNPFLPPEFVAALKKEYAGTVYYDRYILGLWTAAEGVIYRPFADNPERYIVYANEELPLFCNIGVDFGGGTSAHAFSCVGYTRGMKKMCVYDEWYSKEVLTPNDLERAFVDFVWKCKQKYPVSDVYCDSAEQTLIRGLRNAANKAGLAVNIHNALKKPINDRIRCLSRLMAADRFKILARCEHTIEAIQTALWDSKSIAKDTRLDNGTTNIDSLDAMEYAYERLIGDLTDIW